MNRRARQTNRWRWWASMALGLVLILGWGWGSLQVRSEENLEVSQTALRSHLTHLNYERRQASDRATARDYITEQLNQSGYSVEAQPYDSSIVDAIMAENTAFQGGINLIATHPGTDANAGTLLVGAHYDTVSGSPGADDNTSAVATALEIARLFAHKSTPSSLKVVFFDQEERQPFGEGLIGSTAFVQNENNLVGLKGAVILEMLGFSCHTPGCQQYPEGLDATTLPNQGDFLGVLGDTDHPELLQTFENTQEERDQQALTVITLPVPLASLPFLPDLFRSDHAPFWGKGIGAVMVTDTADFRNPHYHRSTDTVETLDLDFLTQAAQKVVQSVDMILSE